MLSIVIVHFARPEGVASWLTEVSVGLSRQSEIIVSDNSGFFRVPPGASARIVRLGGNLGYAAAVNAGISVAVGDRVLIMTDDMYPSIAQIEDLASTHKSLPDRAIVAPALRFETGIRSVGLTNEGHKWTHQRSQGGSEDVTTCDAVDGAMWLVPRVAFDEVGLLREDFFLYWEETEWFSRAVSLGWGVYVCSGIVMDTSSGSANWVPYYQVRNWIVMYRGSPRAMGSIVLTHCIQAAKDLAMSLRTPERLARSYWRVRGIVDGLRGLRGPGPMHA